MKTQIKFRKIIHGKILFGILIAICLMAVSAFGQEEQTKSKKSEQIQEKVYDKVDQMPEFPGGETELVNFIAKSVQYPAESKKKGIQGKVIVNFIIGKDGSVLSARITRAVDPLIDAEALRVINSMPKWTPGMEKGKDVAVQYTLPINFTLK